MSLPEKDNLKNQNEFLPKSGGFTVFRKSPQKTFGKAEAH